MKECGASVKSLLRYVEVIFVRAAANVGIQDQLGAASLLWRLEMRDTDVGNRWDDIADYMAPHIKEHIQPFIDLHYVSSRYCLIGLTTFRL